MVFDYTQGKKVGYLVTVGAYHKDKYYFHDLKDARRMFKKMEAKLKDGYNVSLYNVVTGKRELYTTAVRGFKIKHPTDDFIF